MLNPKIEKLMNEQIRNELYSAYLYMAFAAWLAKKGLNGYAHWFRIQAQEETDHAKIFMYYIIATDGRVHFLAIDEPVFEYDSVAALLQMNLDHEQKVTALIYNIAKVAQDEQDYKTVEMLKWLISEQVEEENNATNNIQRYALFGADGKGLYMLDTEMNARLYVQAAPLVGQPV
jgi:ferritin